MNETDAIQTLDATPLATIRNPPEVVLIEAKKAAQALRDVIALKPRPVIMNGEQYLEFEDWQTVGRFYGVTAREDGDPEYVDMGGVHGFKASAVALNDRGDIISRATAYCLNDEEKWRERSRYEWVYHCRDGSTSVEDPGPDNIIWEENPNKPGKKRPKKERVLVGTEAVPLFQLSSMAQTRANAKALRNVLSWVVVLAGYRPTPAEEMDGVFQPPTSAAAPATPRPEPSSGREPGDDSEPAATEREAYERAGVEPPERKPAAAKAAAANKAPCPQCGKPAFPSKYPKANQTHYCGLCKVGFAA